MAEVEGALAKMDETIARHKQKTLPQLWNALSALRVLPVLHADYDAKLERQGKRSHVLDRVRASATSLYFSKSAVYRGLGQPRMLTPVHVRVHTSMAPSSSAPS